MDEPPSKRPRTDGSLERVDRNVIEAASDPDKWIAERKKNWPTKERVEAREKAQAEAQLKNPLPTVEKSAENNHSPVKGVPRRVCRYFLQGKCRHGENCKFSHDATPRPMRPPGERVYKRYEAPPQSSLFVKLVQTDLDHEDAQVLRFIEWLDQTGHLN